MTSAAPRAPARGRVLGQTFTGVSFAGISPARHDTLVLTRTRAHAPTDTHTQHRRTRVHTEAWASHIHTPHTPACRKGRARSQREKGEKSSGSFTGFQRLVQTRCFQQRLKVCRLRHRTELPSSRGPLGPALGQVPTRGPPAPPPAGEGNLCSEHPLLATGIPSIRPRSKQKSPFDDKGKHCVLQHHPAAGVYRPRIT